MLGRQVRVEHAGRGLGPPGAASVALGQGVAGVLHLVAAVGHLEVGAPVAAALASAGLVQLGGAWAVRRPAWPAAGAVVALTVSLVVLALASHATSTGSLLGAAHPHRLASLGWATVTVQVLTVAAWLRSTGGAAARRRFAPVAVGLFLGGLAAAAMPPQLGHGQHHDAASDPHGDLDHGDGDHHPG